MINKDEQIIARLQPISLLYVESNVLNEDYVKGQIHYDLCKILCSFVTGRHYDHAKDSSLKHRIHKITTDITDSLDVSIGLPVPVGYTPAKIEKTDMPLFASKLSVKLIEAMKREDKAELLELVW